MNNHGVGAKQMGKQPIIVANDAEIPNPARQVQTAGGKPNAKQLPAAVNPAAEKPPAAPMHAAQEAGPDCTLVKQDMMTITSKNVADSFDILVCDLRNFYAIGILVGIYTKAKYLLDKMLIRISIRNKFRIIQKDKK